MPRWLRIAFGVAVTAPLSVGAWELGYCEGMPYAIRSFKEYREAFAQTAARVKDGALRVREDNQGYVVPAVLADLGIRYVRRDNACVVFIFATGPICPTDRILFSPNGR